VSDRDPWAWIAPGLTYFAVFVITCITAAVSYEHEYELARRTGQVRWVSSVLPFTVDGMILAASVVILWAASQGIRCPLRPLGVLAVGIAATIAANLAAGIGHGWLGAGVSAWSGFALILMSDVGMWLAAARRRLAGGPGLQTASDCRHPAPPVTLAEALTMARGELMARGEKHGEQQLAGRFGVSRYEVRKALAPAGAAGLNGDGHDD
jgi:Protein of unknown function (DUF2637)